MAEKEYIERNAVVNGLRAAIKKYSDDKSEANIITALIFQRFAKEIEAIPDADVASVRHGRWKKSKGNERPTENGFVHDDRYVCDCCGWGCCCETKLDFSYCPNCGAKMDGDADANGNDNKTPET